MVSLEQVKDGEALLAGFGCGIEDGDKCRIGDEVIWWHAVCADCSASCERQREEIGCAWQGPRDQVHGPLCIHLPHTYLHYFFQLWPACLLVDLIRL